MGLPEGWTLQELKHLCKFENGDRGKNYPNRSVLVETGIPFINAGHLVNEKIDLSIMSYIPRERYELLSNGKIKKNDILYCLRGSLGKFAIVDNINEGAIASSLVIIRPNSSLNFNYLAFYLASDLCRKEILKYENGAAQPNLSAKSLALFRIPLPSLSEQKRIVAILDEAFAGISQAIANTEKNLANARELFESYLNEIFTNQSLKLVKLSDISESISDGDHAPPPKAPEGISFITISNINKETREIDFSDTFKVPPSYYNELKKNRKPQTGDILYTVTGSFGISVKITSDFEFCFQRHIGLIRPKSDINTNWLYYALLSPFVFKQANEQATGTAQKTVSLNVLRNIKIPLMDSISQLTTANYLDDLWDNSQKLTSIYQQKLQSLAELKQSLLQKAFSGELTANNVDKWVNP
jgi:type I restriction enzyme S subunit